MDLILIAPRIPPGRVLTEANPGLGEGRPAGRVYTRFSSTLGERGGFCFGRQEAFVTGRNFRSRKGQLSFAVIVNQVP